MRQFRQVFYRAVHGDVSRERDERSLPSNLRPQNRPRWPRSPDSVGTFCGNFGENIGRVGCKYNLQLFLERAHQYVTGKQRVMDEWNDRFGVLQ